MHRETWYEWQLMMEPRAFWNGRYSGEGLDGVKVLFTDAGAKRKFDPALIATSQGQMNGKSNTSV